MERKILDFTENAKENIAIRLMEEPDLDGVMAVERSAHVHPWQEKDFVEAMQHSAYRCHVLCDGDGLIGYVVVQQIIDEAEILNICIAPAYQDQGCGTYLLSETCKMLYAQQVQNIFLEVRQSNQAAIALYRKLGFKRVGTRKNYYPTANGREDAYRFGAWHQSIEC